MNALKTFNTYLARKGIRRSLKREQVLTIFLECEKHVTAAELSDLVRASHPAIGIATVYRALRLFADSGMARAIEFGDAAARYEHDYGHAHHDHLVCDKCGAIREINNARIEQEQERVAKANGFTLLRHKMVLHGHCSRCRQK